MKLVSVDEMRKIEAEANERGVSYEMMMERAGLGVAEVIRREYADLENPTALGLVGSGNNGGDALVALAALAQAGWKARAYLARARQANDPLVARLVQAGGEVLLAAEDVKKRRLDVWLEDSAVLLDGILGTGTKLPLKPELAELLRHVASLAGRLHVVAVDCPSGVDCDTGEADEAALPAEITLCMQAVKPGLVNFPAFMKVGRLAVIDLALPADLKSAQTMVRQVADRSLVSSFLPARPMDAHKGTFGTAMIVAGSINYSGAAYLAGRAAYRVGAGLVRLAIPGPLHTALAGQLPEATWLILPHEMGVIEASAAGVISRNLDKADALLIGPGLGQEGTTAEFLQNLLSEKSPHVSKGSFGFVVAKKEEEQPDESVHLPPLVIDADGLNLLARLADWPRLLPPETVLTPHPGEMSRLTGLPTAEIQAQRVALAEQYAKEWRQVVVLKGALTVVAGAQGQTCIIPVATAALARAGTGDVLAGIIVGLRAQGVPAFQAAVAGAWLHAQAGLKAAEWMGTTASVLAGDVLDSIPEVLQELQPLD